MTTRTAWRLLTPLLTLLTLLTVATTVHASGGLYTYVACSNPDTGQGVLPADGIMPPGFTANSTDQRIGVRSFDARCGWGHISQSRGGVEISPFLAQASNVPGGVAGGLTFVPPTGVAPRSLELYWNGTTGSAANHMGFSIHSGPWSHLWAAPLLAACDWGWSPGCTSVGNFSNPWAAANRVMADPAPSAGFSVTLACAIPDSSWTCTANSESSVRFFGGKIVLRDATAPQASGALSGSLIESGAVKGVADVTANATDVGSGVYRVKVLIDDVVKVVDVPSNSTGWCYDVNPAGNSPPTTLQV